MANIKAFYTIEENMKKDILNALDENFGLKGTYIENYISMRGKEESGIETVRLSIEGEVIKIMVVLEDDTLLEKFNAILGEPTKIKGRRRHN
jgi:translation initiation factor 2 alpha subunit (eIF-2alpha)